MPSRLPAAPGSPVFPVMGLVFCGLFLVFLLGLGLFSLVDWRKIEINLADRQKALASDEGPFVPDFPPLQLRKIVKRFGIEVHEVELGDSTANPRSEAGVLMKMRVFKPRIPEGQESHAAESLACVLVPPGTDDPFVGSALYPIEDLDELFPYANAGLIVVHFSVDGELPESVSPNPDMMFREWSLASPRLQKADGGMVNARYALEFALRELPEVDPTKIFIAGFGMGGTVALRFAAQERRLAGCVAYAPAMDLVALWERKQKEFPHRALPPGGAAWAASASLVTQDSRFGCPVLVMHSRADEVFPFEATEKWCQSALSRGVDLTFADLEYGGHHEIKLEPGVLTGVNWILDRASGKPYGKPTREEILNNPNVVWPGQISPHTSRPGPPDAKAH